MALPRMLTPFSAGLTPRPSNGDEQYSLPLPLGGMTPIAGVDSGSYANLSGVGPPPLPAAPTASQPTTLFRSFGLPQFPFGPMINPFPQQGELGMPRIGPGQALIDEVGGFRLPTDSEGNFQPYDPDSPFMTESQKLAWQQGFIPGVGGNQGMFTEQGLTTGGYSPGGFPPSSGGYAPGGGTGTVGDPSFNARGFSPEGRGGEQVFVPRFPADQGTESDARRRLGERQQAQILNFLSSFSKRGAGFRSQLSDVLGSEGERELARIKGEDVSAREKLQELLEGRTQGILEETSGLEAAARGELKSSLAEQATGAFERINPFLLEDLQRRGLFTSESAVGRTQAETIGDLERESMARLSEFDVGTAREQSRRAEQLRGETMSRLGAFDVESTRQRESDIRRIEDDRQKRLLAMETQGFQDEEDLISQSLSALQGGEMSAFDLATSIALQRQQFNAEQALEGARRRYEQDAAERAAKRGSRNSLMGALIGGAGAIVGGIYGGPVGASVGYGLGSTVGSNF